MKILKRLQELAFPYHNVQRKRMWLIMAFNMSCILATAFLMSLPNQFGYELVPWAASVAKTLFSIAVLLLVAISHWHWWWRWRDASGHTGAAWLLMGISLVVPGFALIGLFWPTKEYVA